jgi:MFS family permease
MTMRKLRPLDYVALNIYWFGLAFLWNSLHPIILPAILLRFVPEALKNTYLGGLTFLGLILAMVVQPIAGALSDRSTSRWGRRRPYILIGTLFDLVFLAAMGLAGGYWTLFLAYILLQIASNLAHGPAQGLIPDLVPEERRGLASGVKNLFDMGGLVAASAVAGYFMGQEALGLGAALGAIALVLVATLLVTLFAVHEEPPPPVRGKSIPQALREAFVDTFRVDTQRHARYVRLMASRFLILLGIYAVQTFAQYYIRDVLKVPQPAQVTGNLMATIGLALTILVFPAGYLTDRVGRKPLNLAGGLLMALGVFLLLFVRGYTDLLIYGGLTGAALGVFLSANWALATDLVPQAEAGKYLGLSNLATAGAGAAARLSGPIVDLFNIRQAGQGYSVLFVLATLSILAGTALLLKVKEVRAGT